jgi:hypothetical protein
MHTGRKEKRTKFAAALFLAAALSATILLVGPRARADEGHECQERIEKAEAKLDKAVRQHGWRSKQAEKRQADLNAARAWCWDHHHRWYNSRDRSWHNDRDWDRDDNRDRDHDDHR